MHRHLFAVTLVLLAAVAGGVGAVTAAGPPAGGARHASLATAASPANAASSSSAAADANANATAVANASCSYPFTATDATGTRVTVNRTPKRIVVVGPSATQTVWDVGASGRVVGLWKAPSTTYLANASAKANVADSSGYARPEAVLNASPDLVLLANVQKNSTARTLRKAGVTVYKFNASSSIPDIYAKTNLTGHLVGACGGAANTTAWMHRRLATVDRVRERATGTPAMYYPMGGGYTVGKGSFISDVMARAGARNVVLDANVSGAYPKVSEEFVVQHPPDWLLATYDPGAWNRSGDPRTLLPKSQAINHTDAYQHGRVVAVNANYLSQPAPRVVYAVENVTKAVHPDAWAAVHADANASTTANASGGPNATTTGTTTRDATSTPTSSSGSPGFGAAVALAGLLAAALVARRT